MFNQSQIAMYSKKWGICLSVVAMTLSCSELFSEESSPAAQEILTTSETDVASLDYLVDQILSTENVLVVQEKDKMAGALPKLPKDAPDASLITSCAPKQVPQPVQTVPQLGLENSQCSLNESCSGCESPSYSNQECGSCNPCGDFCETSNSKAGVCCGVFPYLGATGGRGIGWDRDYTTLGVMFVSGNSAAKLQPFVDFKWHYNTDRLTAVNTGIGIRLRPDCTGVTFGGNVYYDYRDGCYGDLHQIGVGMEAYSRCVEVRVNGYFPIQTEACHNKVVFDDYVGNYFVSFQPCQFPLTGADGEAGVVLFGQKNFRVFVGAGGYYFNNRLNMYAMGARGHLSLRYTDKVGFDIYATTDKLFRNRVWGEFYISLPFSCFSSQRRGCNSCCQTPCNPCYKRVYRNDWIVLRNGCCWDFNFDDSIGRKDDDCNSCGCNGCGCR